MIVFDVTFIILNSTQFFFVLVFFYHFVQPFFGLFFFSVNILNTRVWLYRGGKESTVFFIARYVVINMFCFVFSIFSIVFVPVSRLPALPSTLSRSPR